MCVPSPSLRTLSIGSMTPKRKIYTHLFHLLPFPSGRRRLGRCRRNGIAAVGGIQADLSPSCVQADPEKSAFSEGIALEQAAGSTRVSGGATFGCMWSNRDVALRIGPAS